MLKKFSWRIGALMVSAAALVALVGASIAPAASHKASAGTMRDLDGRRPQGRDHQGRERLVGEERRQRPGRAEGVRRHPQPARDRQGRGRSGRRSSPRTTGRVSSPPTASSIPLVPKASSLKAIPAYARKAFTYGKLYGMPVALENVGLFVNTGVAKVPKSWPDLEKKALAFQKKGGGRVGLAVQQGSGGDAYHMYPFFSGLCGYVFGTSNGRLNPKKVGVDNKVFIKNSPLINKWNKEGLISSKINGDTATQLFTSGKAAYWVTGPWNIDTARKAGINFKIVQIPKIKCNAVPFLGVQGLMVTKYASGHSVATAAKDFVANYMSGAGPQATLAAANNRFPANTAAGKRVSDPSLKQIGLASKGGVPMPNIPAMASVWGDLGDAWVKSTKGSGATPAAQAFKTAAKNIRAKIAGG